MCTRDFPPFPQIKPPRGMLEFINPDLRRVTVWSFLDRPTCLRWSRVNRSTRQAVNQARWWWPHVTGHVYADVLPATGRWSVEHLVLMSDWWENTKHVKRIQHLDLRARSVVLTHWDVTPVMIRQLHNWLVRLQVQVVVIEFGSWSTAVVNELPPGVGLRVVGINQGRRQELEDRLSLCTRIVDVSFTDFNSGDVPLLPRSLVDFKINWTHLDEKSLDRLVRHCPHLKKIEAIHL